jgi:hypothetical protein
MNHGFGVAGPRLRSVVLAMAIIVGMSTRVFAADQIDDALSDAGNV